MRICVLLPEAERKRRKRRIQARVHDRLLATTDDKDLNELSSVFRRSRISRQAHHADPSTRLSSGAIQSRRSSSGWKLNAERRKERQRMREQWCSEESGEDGKKLHRNRHCSYGITWNVNEFRLIDRRRDSDKGEDRRQEHV